MISGRDETGIIVDWLLKLIVLFGVLGVLGVEGVGVLLAHYHAAEGASAAATQAALGLRSGGVTGDPEALAKAGAQQHGCELVSMTRDPRTQTISVTVRRQARTFLIQKIEALDGLTRATATENASYQNR